MTLTIPDLEKCFAARIAAKGWMVPDGTIAGEIRHLMDYCRGLILGNLFKSQHDLEYQAERYLGFEFKNGDVSLGLSAATAVQDFVKACLIAAQEEIDETGSAHVTTASEASDKVFDLYEKGFDQGYELFSWPGLNQKFRTAKKQLTVLTGMGGLEKVRGLIII